MRHFPPPWTIEALDGGFKVVDANKQSLAYVYGPGTDWSALVVAMHPGHHQDEARAQLLKY
jgi:hypothetical protein